jgi:hypothetical protein
MKDDIRQPRDEAGPGMIWKGYILSDDPLGTSQKRNSKWNKLIDKRLKKPKNPKASLNTLE